MTSYPLGMSQEQYDAAVAKMRPVRTIDIALDEGGSTEDEVDTLDWAPEVYLEIHHVDVAQGESTVLALMCADPTGAAKPECIFSAVIDGGLEVEGGGMLVRLLHRLGVDAVDAVIISHFDKDHFAGLARVLEHIDHFTEDGTPLQKVSEEWKPLDVQNIFVRRHPAETDEEGRYLVKQTGEVKDLARILSKFDDERVKVVEEGDEIVLDCDADRGLFKMTCLAVNMGGDDRGGPDDENANSIAWLVQFGKYAYYTAGDLPTAHKGYLYEDALIDRLADHAPLTAIKCGHHGADTSTSSAFLEAVKPRVAFISAGKQDGFGHPRPSTLLRLRGEESVRVVGMTNCMYVRPLAHGEYPAYVYGELTNVAKSARDALEAFLELVPDPSKLVPLYDREAPVTGEASEVLNWIRDDFIDPLGRDVEALASSSFAAVDQDLLDRLAEYVGAFEQQMVPERPYRKRLNRLANLKLRGGGTPTMTTDDIKEYVDAVRGALRALAVRAKEVADAKSELGHARGAPLHALVAGGGWAMGNIVLRMRRADAGDDARVAFLGLHDGTKWQWTTLSFGDVTDRIALPRDDYSALVDVPELSTLEVPGSPSMYEDNKKRTFSEYAKKRREQRDSVLQVIREYPELFDDVDDADAPPPEEPPRKRVCRPHERV